MGQKCISPQYIFFENSKFLSEIVYVTDDIFNIRLASNSFKPTENVLRFQSSRFIQYELVSRKKCAGDRHIRQGDRLSD